MNTSELLTVRLPELERAKEVVLVKNYKPIKDSGCPII